MKVSINILTKNRAELLKKAFLSISRQTFSDYEIVVVNDGSTDETQNIIQTFKHLNIQIITHQLSLGITTSRQEALLASSGEYIAILDDDDEWMDVDKLKKQVGYLDGHPECALVGGLINLNIERLKDLKIIKRPEMDAEIRKTMLFRNNFFTSTAMFRREAALKAGGFIYPVRDTVNTPLDNLHDNSFKNNINPNVSEISNGVKDADDFGEDYDLWLRMGKSGKMHNFQEVFTLYRQPSYNRERFKAFLKKQLRLIKRHKSDYPGHWLAKLILGIRTII